jgi:hypothetical protein
MICTVLVSLFSSGTVHKTHIAKSLGHQFNCTVLLLYMKIHSSVLVLNGNGADVAKHCVPAVPTKRLHSSVVLFFKIL